MQCSLCYAVKKIFFRILQQIFRIDVAKCYDRVNLRHICLLLPKPHLMLGSFNVDRTVAVYFVSSTLASHCRNTCVSANVLLECKVSERFSSEIY